MNELFSKLGIDWRLLLAQMINFGILVFVLTKFLYRPMLKLLDERRQKIAEGLAQAEEAAKARRETEEWRKLEEQKLRQEADRILAEAKTQGEALQENITAKAFEEANRIREQTRKDLERERQRVFQEAQKELAGLAIFAAEKVLERSMSDEDTKKAAEEAVKIISAK